MVIIGNDISDLDDITMGYRDSGLCMCVCVFVWVILMRYQAVILIDY